MLKICKYVSFICSHAQKLYAFNKLYVYILE